MGELQSLIEAARLGMVEEVRAIAHRHPELLNQRDETGATALHYAAFGGHRDAVRVLVEAGADINAVDEQFGATPAGWAIEYLRGMGGFLGIELGDFAFAIQTGNAELVARFLQRFPALRQAKDTQGKPFRTLAEESGHVDIQRMFGESARPDPETS